mmetsp:Transcript_5684/g.10631  ORF Transcript_5684/g.10631 Transcript_5684/m.10631 type:complete len:131 (+) Transcript_5684:139-531(+)
MKDSLYTRRLPAKKARAGLLSLVLIFDSSRAWRRTWRMLIGSFLTLEQEPSPRVFEVGKKMLVVINEGLMDNHQKELANALEAAHALKSATCSSLLDNLKQLDTLSFEPFSPSPGTFAQLVDEELFEAAP